MRLSPIEKPTQAKLKLAYLMSKRRLGKVITPLKVVYARVPASLKMGYEISKLTEGGFTLDSELQLLLQMHTAQLNDCAFCVDIGQAIAMRGGTSVEKVRGLADFRNNPLFNERERAALEYVEEATRNKRVSDATFARLRGSFDENAIAEITLLNAIENFYNLVNLPLEIESDGLCAIARPDAIGDEMSSSVPN